MRILPLALATFVALAPSTAAVAADAPTLSVGVIVDATGPAGAYGTTQKNALALAADDIAAGRIDAGHTKVTFDVEDAATDPAQVVTLMQKFATGGTSLVIGPTLSGEAFKADPIAVHAGVPILAISNTADGIPQQGPCVYRDALSEEQVIPEAVARVQKSWHAKTAAIIYGDDNAFTKTDYTIFKDVLDRAHVKIVDVETYHTGDVDFKAQLTKIAGLHPDMLVIGSLLAEAEKIVQQAHAVGITSHMIGGNGFNSPKFMQVAGKDAEGVVIGAAYYVGNTFPQNAGFVARYKKKFGSAPDQFAAQAYAAAQIVAAVAKTGATTPAAVCAGLRDLKVVDTVLGPVAFAANRDVRAPSAIVVVRNGSFAYFK